jgi:hypothetical protein
MMSKEEKKEYMDKEDFLNETLEHIEVQTKDGKFVIFKRLTKGEDSKIRKVTMTMIKDPKTKLMEPKIDSEEYQIKLLAAAMVKPKLTEQEVRNGLTGQRADELFMIYSERVGLMDLPQNL